ncbi:MAG: hypothetical protein ACPL4H_01760 [Anaerolineales bacterium]
MNIKQYTLDLEKCAVPNHFLQSTLIFSVEDKQSNRLGVVEITFYLYYCIHHTKRLI